jgi:antitoxin component of MazEF toxin-antitoxin module
MTTQITRTGGAVIVEIPEDLLRQANLSVGDPVEWTLTPTGTLALQSPETEDGYETWKLRQIEAGFAAIDSGDYVDGEKVNEWLRSWGAENELSPPR